MLVPDLIASLTLERDQAVAAFAAKVAEVQVMTERFQLVSEHLKRASGAMQALAGEHQVVLAELREARARELCRLPDGSACRGPETDCDTTNCNAMLSDHHPASAWAKSRATALACLFVDPPTPPASTAKPMPAAALRGDKQPIGLLLP